MHRDFDDLLRDHVEATLDRYASTVRSLEFRAGVDHVNTKREELERKRAATRDPMQDVVDAFARQRRDETPRDLAGLVLGFEPFDGSR